jgi:Ulp1 protease family, C-terminal catalytic domain
VDADAEEAPQLVAAREEADGASGAREEADATADPEQERDAAAARRAKEYADAAALPVRNMFLYPPDQARGRVQIKSDDADRLKPGEYLNDSLVDFYVKYIERVIAPGCMAPGESIFAFSSFFFQRLRSAEKTTTDYAGVQRWTNFANDLFTKRYVFMPICDSWHWSLILIANLDRLPACIEGGGEWRGEAVERPTILYLDSLGSSSHGGSFAKTTKSYLADEWLFRKEQKGDANVVVDGKRAAAVRRAIEIAVRVVKPRVPIQTNEFDCGLYVLWNIVEFLRNRDGFRERCLDRKSASEAGHPSLLKFYGHTTVLNLRNDVRRAVESLTPPDVRLAIRNDVLAMRARVVAFNESGRAAGDELAAAAQRAAAGPAKTVDAEGVGRAVSQGERGEAGKVGDAQAAVASPGRVDHARVLPAAPPPAPTSAAEGDELFETPIAGTTAAGRPMAAAAAVAGPRTPLTSTPKPQPVEVGANPLLAAAVGAGAAPLTSPAACARRPRPPRTRRLAVAAPQHETPTMMMVPMETGDRPATCLQDAEDMDADPASRAVQDDADAAGSSDMEDVVLGGEIFDVEPARMED